MAVLQVNVGALYCYSCVQALRSFIGTLQGIEGVEVDDAMVKVTYSPEVISQNEVRKIVADTVEKLGYKVKE